MNTSNQEVENQNNTYLEEYIEKVKNNEIIVPKKLKKQLKMLEELLEESKREDGRVYYDTTLVDTIIFYSENIYRQTKDQFYGKNLKLMLFQKAFLSALFGFYSRKTNAFWHRLCLFLVARKNGKTQLMAMLVSFFLLIKQGSNIVLASCTDKLALEIYEAVGNACNLLDPKGKTLKYSIQTIRNVKRLNKITRISDESRKNNGDAVGASITIFDELHLLKDSKTVEELLRSRGTQDNPISIYISTQGFIDGGYLDDFMERCRRKLEGESDLDERTLFWIYEQDDEKEVWQNAPDSWYKSNPGLGEIKNFELLEESAKKAGELKSERGSILIKEFNIKQSNKGIGWLDDKFIEMDKEPILLKDMKGVSCVAGVDLSMTTDLCSISLLFLMPDKTKKVYHHGFIPRNKLSNDDDSDHGARYLEWEQKGYITIFDGVENDIQAVAKWLINTIKENKLNLRYVGYDQRFSDDFTRNIKGLKYEVIAQGSKYLSNAIKAVESEFQHGTIKYHDECLKWSLGNARVKSNYEECLIVKDHNSKKIDPVVSLVIAYETYRRHKTDIDIVVPYYR